LLLFFPPFPVNLIMITSSPNWECRHGAAIGLREVLRRHGTGAGKTMEVRSKEELEAQNTAFLDDCAIRLLCVFALDRFCDFVSDQVRNFFFFPFFSLQYIFKLLNSL
jgi:TATA-binding protein-associated factor